jgi:hypothetical protein
MDGIGLLPATRLAQGGDVIDVHSQPNLPHRFFTPLFPGLLPAAEPRPRARSSRPAIFPAKASIWRRFRPSTMTLTFGSVPE